MKTIAAVGISLAVGAGIGLGAAYLLGNTSNATVENIPGKGDDDTTWITWLNSLSSRFPQSTANSIFTTALQKIQPTNVDTSNFRAALAADGIKFTGSFLDTVEDTTSSAISGIGSSISGFFGMGKTIAYILVGGLVVSVVLIVRGVAKHPEVLATAVKMA